MLNSIRNFILEDEFKINIYKNKVNIVNYTKIGHFDFNTVEIYYEGGKIIIKGNNLVISKMVIDEILITGDILNIELR